MVELLDRLCQLLEVDTAVVLLLDDSRSYLHTSVARGLDGAVNIGLGERVDSGFAGRIAMQRQAIVLDPVVDDEVHPLLREKGLRSLLGVPLVSQGAVIGVLHVGSLGQRAYTEEDIELLQSAADRMAMAIQARASNEQRTAAVVLQRSLMPSRLPPIAGLSLAGRYIPGEGGDIGGDWYDVFTLPSGQVCFAVGDVVGHGLRAAVVMGRLRSALRGYALINLEPDRVLADLDRKLQHFEPSQMATLLYGVFDPLLDEIHISSAGHLPAMMAGPNSAAVMLDIPPDPPLGVRAGERRRSTTVSMPPGGVICVYTDGLVERRGTHLDDRLELLRGLVRADDPDDVCSWLMSSLVGNSQPRDDIAVLTIRRDLPQSRNVIVLPAERASLAPLRVAIRRWLSATDADQDATNDLLLAVGEAAANVIEHAYGPAGGTVEVVLDLAEHEVVATVRDNGQWRSPRGVDRGRGLRLMEQCSDRVDIAPGTVGTEVTIHRRLKEDDPK